MAKSYWSRYEHNLRNVGPNIMKLRSLRAVQVALDRQSSEIWPPWALRSSSSHSTRSMILSS